MKRVTLILLMVSHSLFSLVAQTNLTVNLSDPVYLILDSVESRGIIPFLPTAKPYTKADVIKYLELILTNSSQEESANLENSTEEKTPSSYKKHLSEKEIEIVKSHWERLTEKIEEKEILSTSETSPVGDFTYGLNYLGDYRSNVNDIANPHIANGFKAFFEGDISEGFSYRGEYGITIDSLSPDMFYRDLLMRTRNSSFYISPNNAPDEYSSGDGSGTINLRNPGAFTPYTYTKESVSRQNDLIGSATSMGDGTNYDLSMGTLIGGEMTARFFDGAALLRFGRVDREWGAGDGSIYLSETANAFDAFEFHLAPSKGFNLSFTVGALSNWFVDSFRAGSATAMRLLSLQQVEIMPTDVVSLTFFSAAVFGRSFQPSYLFPMIMPFFGQEVVGDIGNTFLGATTRFNLAGHGELYFTGMIDEFDLDFSMMPWRLPRFMHAMQAGFDLPIDILPFGNFALQITTISPFIYAHYTEKEDPHFANGTDHNTNQILLLSYTNQGQNVGYYLPPNSDEYLIKFTAQPMEELSVRGNFKMIRHGTDIPEWSATHTKWQDVPSSKIYGDVLVWLNYNDKPASRNFLEDGVYDWTFSLGAGGDYKLPELPITLSADYTFSTTSWDLNGRNITNAPSRIFQNILAVGVKVN